jgi:hypothetical protein
MDSNHRSLAVRLDAISIPFAVRTPLVVIMIGCAMAGKPTHPSTGSNGRAPGATPTTATTYLNDAVRWNKLLQA